MVTRRKKAVGTVVGSTIFILILLIGFSSLFAIFASNNDYNKTLAKMTQFDLERQSESLSIDSTSFIGSSYAVYRSNTGLNTLLSSKARIWSGTSWSLEKELPSSGSNVRWIRTAYSPAQSRDHEVILVTLSDDGLLDAYVWTGTSWFVTNDIGNVGTTANSYRPFDVAYEKTSGRALLVYGVLSTDVTKDLAYKIWDGESWSAEQYLNIVLATEVDLQVNWVSLASRPTSKNIALIALTSNSRAEAFIWYGSSWGPQRDVTISSSIVTKESIALGWETSSGSLVAVAGEGATGDMRWHRFTTSWVTNATTKIVSGNHPVNWLTMKSDPVPSSNYLMLASVDGAQNFVTVFWNGASWTSTNQGPVDTSATRDADFEWESTGSKGLLVWGKTSGPNVGISWGTFVAPSNFSAVTFQKVGSNSHAWIQLRQNPQSTATMAILGAFLEITANGLGALTWVGTSFSIVGTTTFTADTSSSAYESFAIVFHPLGESGIRITLTNAGAQAIHLISTWVVNSTSASRSDQDLWLSSGESNSILLSYSWFQGQYSLRAITERGNVMVRVASVQ